MTSEWILFAAGNDIWNVVVPVLTIVFFVVVNIFRGLSESAANAPKKIPRPPGSAPQPVKRAGGQKDLEKLLEELGLRRPEQNESQPASPPPTSPPQRKLARRPTTAQRVPAPAPAPAKESLQRRHLHSNLEERHSTNIHSRVEEQHLAPHLGLGISGVDRSPLTSASTPPTAEEQSGLGLFATPSDVTRAFILQTVLGPPRSLQDDRL